jgi:hypothetical protein
MSDARNAHVMPPRRYTRSLAAAERATNALAPLPLPVVLYIFSLLPVDCRMRCAEVCRGWRSVLLERSLWTRLDMTMASGIREPANPCIGGGYDSLLRFASARAGGGLQSLHFEAAAVELDLVPAVAAENAGALRELLAYDDDFDLPQGYNEYTPAKIEAVLAAAPLLRVYATDLTCGDDVEAARRVLRNEAPFAPVHVRHLEASLEQEDEAVVVALAADVAAHPSLRWLTLEEAPLHTPAALDAVVDAALVGRLQRVTLDACGLSSTSVPALARLLSSGALHQLSLDMGTMDAPAAAVLAAALRANNTLTSLKLDAARVYDDATVAAELLGALTGHPSVRVLHLRSRVTAAAHQAAADALGVLVAANAPSLTELDVGSCRLHDVGLRPLFEALSHNTHLRRLNCFHNNLSEAFARDVVLPAVHSNTSLRWLLTGEGFESTAEAERIVSSREAA